MEKRRLTDAQWKVLLCAFMLFLCGLNLVPLTHWERFLVPGMAGTMATEFGSADHEHRKAILGMTANSPLASAGAHAGDLVTYARQSDGYRFLGTDELIPIRLTDRTGKSRDLLVRPAAVNASASELVTRYIAISASIVVALGMGFLIGMRRAGSTALRVLALSLMAIGIEAAAYFVPAGSLSEWCYKLLSPFSYLAAYISIPYFTLQLPQSNPHWHRSWVRRLFHLFAFAWLAQTAAILLYRNDLLPFALQPLIHKDGNASALELATVAIVLIASWCSWRQSTGPEKQRMAWIGACFGFQYFWFSYAEIFAALGVSSRIPLVQSVCIMSSYLGLGYAILRHKLFDVGFAVNRALVYSIMSTVLLLLFSLTEFGVDKLLHFEGREKNVIFDAAVALGIILTFHRIQHWVNHRVDHVFFHHWQAAADKLRAFVERAPHILEPDALQTKFMHAVEEFGRARGAAIYWADAGGTFRLAHATLDGVPATLDGDDDVAIELRHTRAMIDLSDQRRTLPADLVFPLLSHNQIAGMLLVGAKANGHAWRPDETRLLAGSVPRICMTLETLRLQKLERIVAEERSQRLVLERELASTRAVVAELKLAAVGVS